MSGIPRKYLHLPKSPLFYGRNSTPDFLSPFHVFNGASRRRVRDGQAPLTDEGEEEFVVLVKPSHSRLPRGVACDDQMSHTFFSCVALMLLLEIPWGVKRRD
jgi:hypothetical protein